MTHPVSSGSSPSRSSGHVPTAFPTPGTAAPATFTSASAHAPLPSHASTSALHASGASDSGPTAAPPSAAASTVAAPAATASEAQVVPSIPNGDSRKVLPYLFDDAHIDDVLVLVVDMLVRLTEHNDSLPLHPSALTRFHSRAAPNISLSAYLRRIAKYTSIEKCCVLILLVYIDRVCERLEGFTICGLTVHRFICAAILCASKALCDAFNTNEHYAKVGGISLQEINLLEKEFLQIIDWRLSCTGAVLQHYYASLVRNHKDYVLAEPKHGQQKEQQQQHQQHQPQLAGMEVDAVMDVGTNGSSANGQSSGSARIAPPVAPAVAAAQAASANVTPAIGSSQHSSPFPISSNTSNSSTSASPFVPSANGNAGLAVGVPGSAGSRRAAQAGEGTSPSSAMQVDPEPTVAAPPVAPAAMSRRRKDEHRTPPSPRGPSHLPSTANHAIAAGTEAGGQSNGRNVHPPDPAPTHADAYKRTRFDQPQP